MSPYTADGVRNAVTPEQERLFASWSVGRPENWACDPRTRDLICIGNWLSEELTRICANDADRKTQEHYYNRWSRSEEDLWGLAARTLNVVLDGQVEQNRKPHHRWG